MPHPALKNARNGETRSGRDGAQIWIIGTLEMITRGGLGAVKIERLAREIGVSKGSFYWFFQNTDELLKRCLEHWKVNLNNALFDVVRASTGPAQARMFEMIDMVFDSKLGRYDAAIRAWATTDPDVQRLVDKVDCERLDFLIGLFMDHGLEKEDACDRAHLFYRAFIAESYISTYPGAATKNAYLKELLDFLLPLDANTSNRDDAVLAVSEGATLPRSS